MEGVQPKVAVESVITIGRSVVRIVGDTGKNNDQHYNALVTDVDLPLIVATIRSSIFDAGCLTVL